MVRRKSSYVKARYFYSQKLTKCHKNIERNKNYITHYEDIMFNKKKHKKDMEEQQVNVQKEEVTSEQTQETIEETTKTKEEELTEKLEELNKKYLLLYSDFENFRKRTSKEKIELIQNAAENTIKDLLPVVDDYERALVNFEKFEDEKFLKAKEGIELIYNKLMSILTQKGLKPMNAKGEKFDENLHEAIAQVPAESEEQKGIVLDETTKGYYLHEKVIRYAKVVVAM